jgi:putative thioredoxin
MSIDAGRAVDLSAVVSKPAESTAASRPGAPADTDLMLPGLVLQADDSSFASVLDISNTVPVLVCFVMDAQRDEPMVRTLSEATVKLNGRAVLVNVDAGASPQLVASFQADVLSATEGGQSPVVGAVLAGRPLQLFVGDQTSEMIEQVLQQLLVVGEQSGIVGTVTTPDMVSGRSARESAGAGEVPEPEVPPLDPLHQEAFDAIERADYPSAVNAYERALRENPKDEMARAGLAQVSLLARLSGKSLADVRNAAAADPDNLDAQLDVADLDLSGGHIDDAFDRLLGVFPQANGDDRNVIRVRLLELFDVVGAADPRVVAARAKLTNLLF